MQQASDEPSYGQSEYWETRYVEGEGAGHQWYFSFDELAPLLHLLFPDGSEVKAALEIGCGDQPLAPSLAQDAHFPSLVQSSRNVHAIDFAPSVVRSERRKQRSDRTRTSAVNFACMDAREVCGNVPHICI